MTASWEESRLDETRGGPSPGGVLGAIYLSGWIGGIATIFVVHAFDSVGAGGLEGSGLWWQLASALVAGMVLPHLVELFTGAIVYSGGCVIAMLAGGIVSVVMQLLLGPARLYIPGPLGYALSLSTIPWLAVCYVVLKRVELQAPTGEQRGAGVVELATVVIPAGAILAVLFFGLLASSGRSHATGTRVAGRGFADIFGNTETTTVERQLQDIAKQKNPAASGGLVTASCHPTATTPRSPASDPTFFGNPHNHTMHFYDCSVTLMPQGTSQPWCVRYDLNRRVVDRGYVGNSQCEGPPRRHMSS